MSRYSCPLPAQLLPVAVITSAARKSRLAPRAKLLKQLSVRHSSSRPASWLAASVTTRAATGSGAGMSERGAVSAEATTSEKPGSFLKAFCANWFQSSSRTPRATLQRRPSL